MTRSAVPKGPSPSESTGVFAGHPFWSGDLSFLASDPEADKTSLLPRMVRQTSVENLPAALVCSEHTAEILQFRLGKRAETASAGPHLPAETNEASAALARAGHASLPPLSDREETLRAIEETLIEDFAFPRQGPALLVVDYPQRIPVVGIAGRFEESERPGEGATGLRLLSRRRGWAIIAAAALKSTYFNNGSEETIPDLGALPGDERGAYEADRGYLKRRAGEVRECGCVQLSVTTRKNRAGPLSILPNDFFGERFFPVQEGEGPHP